VRERARAAVGAGADSAGSAGNFRSGLRAGVRRSRALAGASLAWTTPLGTRSSYMQLSSTVVQDYYDERPAETRAAAPVPVRMAVLSSTLL
jgi:hypothetical protein